MTTHIHMMDRDEFVSMTKAVTNTLEPEQVETADTFAEGIADLQEQINIAREQLARMESDLDELALAGHVQKE